MTKGIERIADYTRFFQRMVARLPVKSAGLEEQSVEDTRAPVDLFTGQRDDATIALIDAWAAVLDVLTFYQERLANEGFIRTATERRSILELARSIGYELKPGMAEDVYLSFKAEERNDPFRTITIPAGTQVQSTPKEGEKSLLFETNETIEARAEWNAIRPLMRVSQNLLITTGKNPVCLVDPDGTLCLSDCRGCIEINRESRDQYFEVTPGLKALFDDHDPYPAYAVPVKELYLEGLDHELQAGDRMVLSGKNLEHGQVIHACVIRVVSIEKQIEHQITKVGFEPLIQKSPDPIPSINAGQPHHFVPPLEKAPLTMKDILGTWLNHRWQHHDMGADLQANQGDGKRRKEGIEALKSIPNEDNETGIFVFRRKVDIFGHNAPLWESLHPFEPDKDEQKRQIYPVNWDDPDEDGIKEGLTIWRDPNRGSEPAAYDWESGWSAASFYRINGQNFLLLLNSSDGTIRIHPVHEHGTVGDGVTEYPYEDEAGWSEAHFYESKGNIFLMLLNRHQGRARIHRMNQDGTIGKLEKEFEPALNPGWTKVHLHKMGDQSLLFCLSEEEGTLHIHRVRGDFEIEEEIPQQVDLSGKWTALATYRYEKEHHLLLYEKDKGDIHIHSIEENGTVSEIPFMVKIEPGWTAATVFEMKDKVLTLFLDEQTGRACIYILSDGVTLEPLLMDPDHADYDVYLDGAVPSVLPDSWAVFESADFGPLAYRILAADESFVNGFAMMSKATGLKLSGPGAIIGSEPSNKSVPFKVRSTSAYVQSDPLALSHLPIDGDLKGSTKIMLDQIVAGLSAGQTIIITGERSDVPGVHAAEAKKLKNLIHVGGHTVLEWDTPLRHALKRNSVTLNANTAVATHGERIEEVLGHGNALVANQRFKLRAYPLTFIPAPTSLGQTGTLSVRVNGTQWDEVLSLHDQEADRRCFCVRMDENAVPELVFGDGVHGARLPSGDRNVTATYRVGTGRAGEVEPGRLKRLINKASGVKEVNNLLAGSGAGEPEKAYQARRNAPCTARTLDRIVTLKDFEDFARSFTGVDKAQAVSIWNGHHPLVHLTVGAAGGREWDDNTSLVKNLILAMYEARDPTVPFRVAGYKGLFFDLRATLEIDNRVGPSIVMWAIKKKLLETFNFKNREFGQPVTSAEVVTLIQNTEGVVHVDLDALYPAGFEEKGAGLSREKPCFSFLPASKACWNRNKKAIDPAQLLLINPAGIALKEV